MIHLSKINGKPIVVNCELIELVEGGPDTIVTLTTGSKFIVQNPPVEIVRKVIEYRRAISGQGVTLEVHPAEAERIAAAVGEADNPDESGRSDA